MFSSVPEQLLGGLLNALGRVQGASLHLGAQGVEAQGALLSGLRRSLRADVSLGGMCCLREVHAVGLAGTIDRVLDAFTVRLGEVDLVGLGPLTR